MRRAAIFVVLGLIVAPVVVLVPPHIPWLLGALGGSVFIASRIMKGRFAVMGLDARCPRCAEPVGIRPGTRLRSPHPVDCTACHHELMLTVDPDLLPPP